MDGFGDNFVPNGVNGVEDPAADFLAREQSELAGIEDPPPAPVLAEDPVENAEPEVADAILAEPIVEAPVVAPPVERVVTPLPRIEPEAIRLWREEHQQRLVEKDKEEETAKEALREKAKQELVDWYRQHDEQLAKTRHANRCAEKELVAETERPEPGTEWERIARLCDFNPKTTRGSRDVSRMRSIILHVKQSPPVKA